nr:ATP-binding protein [Mycolicibacterium sp. GF69]
MSTARHANRLEAELKKVRRYKLLTLDEVLCIPFGQDAANLFFNWWRHATSGLDYVDLKPAFGRWGEKFSDDSGSCGQIDRLMHHAEVLTLTGDSYRTRQRRQLLVKQDRAADD